MQKSSTTPVLETSRLRLRAHTVEDFKHSATLWARPEVVKHIGGKTSNEQQAWARVIGYRGHWELMGFGYWLVEEKATGLFVGELGFADFKREISPSIKGFPEAGWVIDPQSQGKGYATEALQIALQWRDEHLAGTKTVCIISPGNEPSFRVAQKCGFARVRETTFMGEPVVMLERSKIKGVGASDLADELD